MMAVMIVSHLKIILRLASPLNPEVNSFLTIRECTGTAYIGDLTCISKWQVPKHTKTSSYLS